MTTILIKKLKLSVLVGVLPQERLKPQTILADLRVVYDDAKAVESDDIKDALDYAKLAVEVQTFGHGTQFFLLEKLADGIIQLLQQNPLIDKIRVKLEKPGIIPEAESVSVIRKFRRSGGSGVSGKS